MLFHDTVKDDRAVICQHFRDRIIQIGRIVAIDAFGAEGFSKFHEIWQRFGPGMRIAFAMQQFLPLAHHAQPLIVQDELFHRQAILNRGTHFLHVHQPGRFARHVDDQCVRMRDLHTDGSGRAIAHSAQPAGGHPVIGVFKAQELGGPHLVLADLGTDEPVLAVLGQRLQPFHRVLRFDRLVAAGVGQAFHAAPFIDLSTPAFDMGGVGLAPARFPDLQHVFQHMGHIADNRDVGLDDLVD